MDAQRRHDRTRALGPVLAPDLGGGAGAAALKTNRDAPTDPDAARLHALLEVAYLTASADDKLSDQEIDHLVANLTSWLGEELDAAFLVGLFEHLGAQLAAEGFPRRLAAVAAQLDHDARHVAYKLACVTALCDHEVHDDELAFLGGIADAFGIPAAEAQQIFDELDAAVTSL